MANKETKLQIVVDAQNRTQGVLAKLGENLDAVSKRTQMTRDGMMAVGAAGAAAFAGFALLTKGAVSSASEMEALTAGLTAVAGSSQEANRQLRDLREVAKLPGLGLKEAIQGSINLQAAGFSADMAERSLKAFGNALATVGKGKAELSGVILALQQIASKGKISAEEINQLNERLPQIRQAMKDAFGTADTEELQRMGIGAEQFVEGVVRQFERLPPVAGGSKIAFENVQDSLFMLSNSIGQALLPAVNQIITAVTPVIEKMAAWASEHPKLTAAILVGVLALTGLLAVILPIALALPGLIIMFGALAGAFAAVVAISAQLLLVFGAIAAGLTLLIANGYATGEAWRNVWLGIQLIAADAANAVIRTAEAMINFVIAGVNKAINAINKVIAAVQKVPGLSKLSSIKTLSTVDLGGFDTAAIAADELATRANPRPVAQSVLNMAGSVFLDENVAEKIGDLIFGKLKLSSRL